MMKDGADRMEKGDIAGARLMFQRAAQTGDTGAAFALAESYDPLVLRKLGARVSLMSDIALAQSWYKKAWDLGSTLAPDRILRLTQPLE
jgi:TPR repeat protein